MRTTLTIDDDVEHLLREVCRERGEPFRRVVNEALRAGLTQMTARPQGPWRKR